MSIAYERWKEHWSYVHGSSVAVVHLLGVSLYSLINSVITSLIVLAGLVYSPI